MLIINAIDVTDWREDYDFSYSINGARDKQMLWSPATPPAGIKPNWPYLFKQSRQIYPEQYWMETIAWLTGMSMGIPVPATRPAWKYDSIDELVICGSLSEWFYEVGRERFVDGGDYFRRLIRDFDNEKGKQHNLNDLAILCRWVFKSDTNWLTWIRDLLLFDALIGNTDRHQENWGIVFEQERPLRLSPLFDNGTSLGHENNLEKVRSWSDIRVDKYIDSGRHHLRKTRFDANERLGHMAAIEAHAKMDDTARQHMLHRIHFDEENLFHQISALCDIEVAVPLGRERAEWIIRLLKRRYQRLNKILENDD